MIQIVSSVDFASPFTAPWKLVSFWSHVFNSFSLRICQKYVAARKQLQEYPFTTSPPVIQQDVCFFNKTYPLKQMNICPRPKKFGGPFWKENPVSTNPSFFGKESTGLVERRHASAKCAESSIQQRGLVLGDLGAWWFWDSIGVLTVCTSNFYPFHKRIPTESKHLGPKPPLNHQLINVFQNGCRRKCVLVKNRVDETSAVITVDGSFWLI